MVGHGDYSPAQIIMNYVNYPKNTFRIYGIVDMDEVELDGKKVNFNDLSIHNLLELIRKMYPEFQIIEISQGIRKLEERLEKPMAIKSYFTKGSQWRLDESKPTVLIKGPWLEDLKELYNALTETRYWSFEIRDQY